MIEVGLENARGVFGRLAKQARDGEIIYLTFHNRRICAIVPLDRVKEEEAGAAGSAARDPHRRQPPPG